MPFTRPAVFSGGIPQMMGRASGFNAAAGRVLQATDSAQTIPIAAIQAGLYIRSGLSTGRTDTMPLGVDIAAAFPEMEIGDTIIFGVSNQTAQTLTIGSATGATVSGTATIASGIRWILLEKLTATTFAVIGL